MTHTEIPVELLRNHRHAGRNYTPGQVIRLREDKAAWLISQGVAKAPDTSGEIPAAPTAKKVKG